jgi:protein-tyrosine-phosphatase
LAKESETPPAPPPAPPSSILFLCGENALRSPIAESIAKHLYGERVYADSAGVRSGEADPLAISVMAEIGIDLSRHIPKRIEDLMDTSFELIISLTPEAQHKAVELTRSSAAELLYWPMPDPSVEEGNRERLLAAYRELRDLLMSRITERFGK